MSYFGPCAITYEDEALAGVLDDIEFGEVYWRGESPSAKVTITAYDAGRKRPLQVDIVDGATIEESESHLKVTGRSLVLSDEIGLSDAEARMTLSAKRLVKGCCG